MDTEVLKRAQALTRSVMAAVGTDQLGEATPCESWTVGDVISHVIAANHWFAQSMNMGTTAPEDDRDYASGDYLAAFDESSTKCVTAFETSGAFDKIVSLPFGDLPGILVLYLATSDVFVHGWDIARATGQPSDLDAAIADELLAAMEIGLTDDKRGSDFGPKRLAPDGASPADKLAAFLGRTV